MVGRWTEYSFGATTTVSVKDIEQKKLSMCRFKEFPNLCYFMYVVLHLFHHFRVVPATNVQEIVDRNVLIALCVIFAVFTLAVIVAITLWIVTKFKCGCRVCVLHNFQLTGQSS